MLGVLSTAVTRPPPAQSLRLSLAPPRQPEPGAPSEPERSAYALPQEGWPRGPGLWTLALAELTRTPKSISSSCDASSGKAGQRGLGAL